MADNAVQSVGKGPGNQTRVIVIMGGLIIVALVGVIIALVLNLNHNQGGEQQTEAQLPEQRAILVNEENAEEVVEEIIAEPPVEPGYYEVSMTLTWHFPDGSSPSTDMYVANKDTNTNNVYFDLLLGDSGTVIYQSPVITLGSRLEHITLDQPLGAGTYDATVEYHLVDEQQRTLSTLRMGVTLVVEN